MSQQIQHINMNQPNPNYSYLVVLEQLITAIARETDKKRILGMILPSALAISQTELGALLITDDKQNNLNAVAKQGLPNEIVKQLTTGELGNLLLMGQRLWMKPPPSQINSKKALLGRHKLKFLFGLPLRFAGQVLGAIVVGSRVQSNGALQPAEQQRLAMLAQLVALFLDDIRLRTENHHQKNSSGRSHPEQPDSPDTDRSTERENGSPQPVLTPDFGSVADDDLEQLLAAVMSAEEEVANQNTDLGLLNDIGNEVGSTLQLNAVLEAAIKQTQAAIKAEAGWCYLFKDGVLVLSRYQGLSKRYVEGMQHLELGNGAEGMAFSRNEPILRDGLLFHSGRTRRLVQEEGLRTIAAVPLTNNGEPFGVLAVASHHNRDWSSRDQRMLLSISQKVGQAIANSKKFSEVEEQAQAWETNNVALQQANAQLTARANSLEKQVEELRRVEQQIWIALAASSKARYRTQDENGQYEDLVTTLKKALATMNKKRTELLH